MMKFLTISIICMILSSCIVTTHNVDASDGFMSEAQQHTIARDISVIVRPRWGYQGVRLHSVSNMLSAYMNRALWCFGERVQGIDIAKCTTKEHMDSVMPSEHTYFRYVYAPAARYAGIAIPVFVDDCYLCKGRIRW